MQRERKMRSYKKWIIIQVVLFDYVELALDWRLPIPEEHIQIYNNIIKGDKNDKNLYKSIKPSS